ncbi:GxGYxYP family putative glycoside hydrolase [Paenibacillus sp. VCA1]|uniref:GxGYxYP domain-containing protein n=1 Tax=Paenibacillus sp. VCA1 TaxID=3039148 RepID=UPI002871CE86|nr:GxGYxYP domain-containing protein [Paenibacillus sp. VCA1]MDR9852491.1 GxGYxYP family putative glycoside hydrolase [Paenibacillus sp. VCA1]
MSRKTIGIGIMSCALAAAIFAAGYWMWPEKKEGIRWPEDQALPSFPEPAAMLDLINLSSKLVYEAEDAEYEHQTGTADGDGWLAKAGADKTGVMLRVPRIADVPAGDNQAVFRMSVDRFADENGSVAKLEIREPSTGAVLGSLEATNWDFRNENATQEFAVPFTSPGEEREIEISVAWTGKSTLKLYDVQIGSPTREEDVAMFETVKGVVNKTKPRIYDDTRSDEGTKWLTALGLEYRKVKDNWELLSKYHDEIRGMIVYDPDVADTYNLATTIAGLENAIVVSPSLAGKLAGDPYRLPVLEDLRGKFKTNIEVYEFLYEKYWPQTTHRVLVGLTPDIKTFLRDYAMGMEAAVVWLNPDIPEEEALLNKFMKDMPYGSGLYVGWWPDEGKGVTKTSEFGLATVAADYSSNLSVLSGTSRSIAPAQIPKKPPLENKVYISYIMSDGDNLQYMEHYFSKLWFLPNRGEVPIGWTVSPLMVDAMPGILDVLHRTATENDALISGPSGLGYTYPNFWKDEKGLDRFFARTDDYMQRAGLRVLTVWNTVKGETNPNVGNSIAANAPSLLGFTSQGGTGAVAIYNNTMPGQELNVVYGASEGDLIFPVQQAIETWDRRSPLFVCIQANPWEVHYQSFVNAYRQLKENKDIVVVRPDVYFELIRENSRLPIDPLGAKE